MDRGSLLPFQLWCPRPFGTYSQNQPRQPSAALKPSACPEPGGGAEPDHGPAHSENTPPPLATEASAPQPGPLLSAAAAGKIAVGRAFGGMQFGWSRDPGSHCGKASRFHPVNANSGFLPELNLGLPVKVLDISKERDLFKKYLTWCGICGPLPKSS